jgi:hypothetical protein
VLLLLLLGTFTTKPVHWFGPPGVQDLAAATAAT